MGPIVQAEVMAGSLGRIGKNQGADCDCTHLVEPAFPEPVARQKRRRTYPFRNKCALTYDINDRSIVFAIRALAISRNGPYMKWPHHFMVFVREDMAMPDVASGLVEVHLDARDLAR